MEPPSVFSTGTAAYLAAGGDAHIPRHPHIRIIPLHITNYMYVYIYIYIHIYRERERDYMYVYGDRGVPHGRLKYTWLISNWAYF